MTATTVMTGGGMQPMPITDATTESAATGPIDGMTTGTTASTPTVGVTIAAMRSTPTVGVMIATTRNMPTVAAMIATTGNLPTVGAEIGGARMTRDAGTTNVGAATAILAHTIVNRRPSPPVERRIFRVLAFRRLL